MNDRIVWASTEDAAHFRGAWPWGIDHSSGCVGSRVICVHVSMEELKHCDWIGPVSLTPTTAARLEAWAQDQLYLHGGYVHLYPADGDAESELEEECEEILRFRREETL